MSAYSAKEITTVETIQFSEGSLICSEGEPLSTIMLISKGKVKAVFNGKTFHYNQGDMIGVCDLEVGIYSGTYTAISDVTIAAYPFKNLSALDTLFREKSGVAYLMVYSMCRHLLSLLKHKVDLKDESEKAYEATKMFLEQYEALCAQYAYAAKKLEGASEIEPFSEPDLIDEWVISYYTEIMSVEQNIHMQFFNNRPGVQMGFIRKAAEDALGVLGTCRDYKRYLDSLAYMFINNETIDLFTLISELHLDSVKIKGADAAVEKLMTRLSKLLSGMTGVDTDYYNTRLGEYKDKLMALRATVTDDDVTEAASGGIKQNLVDSISVILEYSECPDDVRSQFVRNISDYTKISDRGSSDDEAHKLRKQLTVAFYDIYKRVLLRSLNDPQTPTIINMFLKFGYVDAELAGYENADYLYSIADSFCGNPELGVYTFPEWMAAIYKGEKEPSRSEFDVDYTEYLRQLKKEGEIDAKEEAALLKDQEKKFSYEMENAFPVVNKITSGAVSLFCPVFSDDNVMRTLDATQVRAESIRKAFDEVREIDFSAYYRPTAYSNQSVGVPNDAIHIEVLPEIILLPNIGTRGMLWQEISARNRATPSRMFVPTFLQTDLKVLAIKLTGEFRWEMCKRIQGARWGDLSDPSLTAEYVDYLQFFNKNRELSSEARGLIKNELSRARSNYKLVFVANYSDWLLYESNGMQRLNKVAAAILYMYCPFPAEVRDKLIETIPRFSNLCKKFNIKQFQRTKHLTNITKKIQQNGKQVPKEILDELEYSKR